MSVSFRFKPSSSNGKSSIFSGRPKHTIWILLSARNLWMPRGRASPARKRRTTQPSPKQRRRRTIDGSRGWCMMSRPTIGRWAQSFPSRKRKSVLHRDSKSFVLKVIPSSFTSKRSVLKYTVPAIFCLRIFDRLYILWWS
ncbi:hypothetical protein STAS_07796 [Striga asiatica]|uniref:Uncharacterized protein n=1 Tax=Striga asiatica TaxID=4170 RepID=A0A5A7PG75_STRAF|nr:hypothetical protein STAS_07796 [Striga asiatica]